MSLMQLLPVDAELSCTQCKSLSRKEQKKYYQATAKERLRHQQQYPGLSNNDNYDKMRTKAEKRKLRKSWKMLKKYLLSQRVKKLLHLSG
ncbi:lymphoid enhancer-binding factor 1-like [Takifugu flavidus]|uniref:lymphoid enhancer-binding factor 1-like n=1 Tax=Takifugu flavidus TaxID=433684 RepID=UPI0025448AC9|nr:lymphoid enhancer-binding factor 1-like [Takifugu flavidus]